MSEQYLLSDDDLDELFVMNIGSVARIAEKLPRNSTIITTCKRWFEIFEQAKHDEKLARNFLLIVMHKQLNDKNKLSYPFTDARTCQRDLNTLYRLCMQLQLRDRSDEDVSELKVAVSEREEAASDREEAASELEEAAGADGVVSAELLSLQESYHEMIERNAKLETKLHALQCEKEKLLQIRQQSRKNLETLKEYGKIYQKEICYMKNIFFCSAITSLDVFEGINASFPKRPEYFISIFKVFCNSQKDKEEITLLDELLGHIIRENLDHNIRERMCSEVVTKFDELRDKVSKKYKNIIEHREDVQTQELALWGMNDLMLLKQLFKDSFKGDEELCTKAIKYLKKEYNGMNTEQ